METKLLRLEQRILEVDLASGASARLEAMERRLDSFESALEANRRSIAELKTGVGCNQVGQLYS
jgi:hypothetical protein